MERIGDAFVWPLRDPDWLNKVLIMGLILLIPIVGGINGLGWMLATIERLRAGDERLPPANFDYLGRGFQLFVVFLAYYVVLALIAALLYVPALAILVSQSNQSPNVLVVIVGVGVLVLASSFVTLASLALTFALPSIVLAFDRGGIEAGLHVDQVVRRTTSSLVNTLIAGLMLIAAGVVGQLGSIACFVGVVFTSAYALAMQAWIIRSFEVGARSAIVEGGE